jgi:endonuclease YncB( thermonuclease family)
MLRQRKDEQDYPTAGPKQHRFGTKAVRFYTLLVALVVAVNLVSFMFREQIVSVYRHLSHEVYEWWVSETLREAESDSRFRYEVKPLDLFSLSSGPFSRFHPNRDFQPPYRVSASDRLFAGSDEIRISYVQGIGPTDLCLSVSGTRFPCGLMGRASLQNRISINFLKCMPVFYPGPDVRYECRLPDGTDLSEFQVRAGYARPDFLAPPAMFAAMKSAVEKSAGAWSGEWTVMSLDGSK